MIEDNKFENIEHLIEFLNASLNVNKAILLGPSQVFMKEKERVGIFNLVYKQKGEYSLNLKKDIEYVAPFFKLSKSDRIPEDSIVYGTEKKKFKIFDEVDFVSREYITPTFPAKIGHAILEDDVLIFNPEEKAYL